MDRLFEQQTRRSPGAVAVASDAGDLTYAELDRRAGRLAQRLLRLGVGPEAVVGVLLDRSPAAVVAMLAVVKAGGAYLPLDPAYPRERLDLMLADSGAGVLVTTPAWREALPGLTAPAVIELDAEAEAPGAEAPEAEAGRDPDVTVSPDALAYVMYTSGSTGRPKGVMVRRGSLAGYVRHAVRAFELGPCDRVLQFAPLSFDTSAEEIFPCLASGATLVLRSEEMLGSAAAFLGACERAGISVLDLPTAYWHEHVAGMVAGDVRLPACVRLVVIGGERALPDASRPGRGWPARACGC